jgi:putative SOS response-associated peptidase YedK
MCGRFTNRLTWEEPRAALSADNPSAAAQSAPRYNICPTDPVDVVTERDGNRDFVRMRWGLVPSWWPKPLKELKAGTFNARAETVAEKPARRENNFVVSCLQNPDDHSADSICNGRGHRRIRLPLPNVRCRN